jgi:hypothetical protein
LNNIKLARILCLIFFVGWILHGIPFLIYLNIIESDTTLATSCAITNINFLLYFYYGFVITLLGFLPIFITILFGVLAYLNVQQSNYQTIPLIRRELDKQLTIMVLVQVVYNSVVDIPYILLYIIMRIPNITKGPFRSAQFQLASAVLTQMYYLHYAVRIDCFWKNIVHL